MEFLAAVGIVAVLILACVGVCTIVHLCNR
jgi:hypothetical protein